MNTASTTAAVSTRPESRGTTPRGRQCPSWVTRAHFDFVDARTNPMSPRQKLAIMALESYCGDRSYAWVGNRELFKVFGLKKSAGKALIRDLERDGAIRRVLSDSGKTERTGIILLVRSDPDRPVADPDAPPDDPNSIHQAIRRLEEARERHQAPREEAPSARKTGPPAAG